MDDRKVVIGLTGGIASGKSNIRQLLEEAGAIVFDADKFGHNAYPSGSECFENLVEYFGEKIVGEDGEIDRKVLGGIVFADPKDSAPLNKLNEIVWPSIRRMIAEEVDKVESGSTVPAIVVVEAAVLIEAKWYDMMDEIWGSFVPPAEAKARLVDRNKLSEEEAMNRIAKQISNEERTRYCDVTIWTDRPKEETAVAVRAEYHNLLKRYNSPDAFRRVDVVDRHTDQVIRVAKLGKALAFLHTMVRTVAVVVRMNSTKKYLVQTLNGKKHSLVGLTGVVYSLETYEQAAERLASMVCKDPAKVMIAVNQAQVETTVIPVLDANKDIVLDCSPRESWCQTFLIALEAESSLVESKTLPGSKLKFLTAKKIHALNNDIIGKLAKL